MLFILNLESSDAVKDFGGAVIIFFAMSCRARNSSYIFYFILIFLMASIIQFLVSVVLNGRFQRFKDCVLLGKITRKFTLI